MVVIGSGNNVYNLSIDRMSLIAILHESIKIDQIKEG